MKTYNLENERHSAQNMSMAFLLMSIFHMKCMYRKLPVKPARVSYRLATPGAWMTVQQTGAACPERSEDPHTPDKILRCAQIKLIPLKLLMNLLMGGVNSNYRKYTTHG